MLDKKEEKRNAPLQAFYEWRDENPPPSNFAPIRDWYLWGQKAFNAGWKAKP